MTPKFFFLFFESEKSIFLTMHFCIAVQLKLGKAGQPFASQLSYTKKPINGFKLNKYANNITFGRV